MEGCINSKNEYNWIINKGEFNIIESDNNYGNIFLYEKLYYLNNNILKAFNKETGHDIWFFNLSHPTFVQVIEVADKVIVLNSDVYIIEKETGKLIKHFNDGTYREIINFKNDLFVVKDGKEICQIDLSDVPKINAPIITLDTFNQGYIAALDSTELYCVDYDFENLASFNLNTQKKTWSLNLDFNKRIYDLFIYKENIVMVTDNEILFYDKRNGKLIKEDRLIDSKFVGLTNEGYLIYVNNLGIVISGNGENNNTFIELKDSKSITDISFNNNVFAIAKESSIHVYNINSRNRLKEINFDDQFIQKIVIKDNRLFILTVKGEIISMSVTLNK